MRLPLVMFLRIAALAIIALGASPSFASQKTKAQLTNTITSTLPTTGQGQITAAILRAVLQDMVDSYQQINLINAQTGTTYTLLASDQGKLVTFCNAGAVAVTLPQGIGDFGAGYNVLLQNICAGAVTVTPTLSTINGAATPITLNQDQVALVVSAGLSAYRSITYGVMVSVTCGAGLSGGVITTTGTCSITDTISSNSSVGSTSLVPVISFNSRGQLTTVTTATISAGSVGALAAANNLSDVANITTSRTNLGLATIAATGSASDLSTGTVSAARMPALTGDVTTTVGTVATTISPGAVTNAKLALVPAGNVIGNPTSSTSPAAYLTFSQLTDTITTGRGSILYRGSSGWTYLAPGASGQVLSTGGAGADPSYITVAGTGTVTTITQGRGMTFSTNPITTTGTISADVASAANFQANTADKLLDPSGVWSAADLVTLSDAATITPDFSTGINFALTLGGNRQLGSPTNAKTGQTGVIWIAQDSTGSRTLSYGSNWKFAGGTAPTLSTTPSFVDMLAYMCRTATFCIGSLTKDFR